MPTMQQPEAYIGGADKLFDAGGKITNDGTRGFLTKFMEAYAAWVEKHPSVTRAITEAATQRREEQIEDACPGQALAGDALAAEHEE